MSKELVLVPEIVEPEWYQCLINDCELIITKTKYDSAWMIIEGYQALGLRILSENENFNRSKIYGLEIVARVRESLGISASTIWRAIQFATKYPYLKELRKIKKLTWHKICRDYLPAYISEESKNILAPISGEYEVIVIDPPWPYGTEYDKESRRVASPYKELSLEELQNFKIPAAKDCVLWLWSTHKFLHDAFHLIETWGFEYKLCLVWDKEKMGIGFWLRCQAEFCLLAIKGKPKWNLTNERDIIKKARGRHSAKPDNFYSMVEKLCPTNGERLDIFARRDREGWEISGNEV